MTNMRILKKTRKSPQVGDYFVLQIVEGKYHWGRVIKKDVVGGGYPNSILVYIYNVCTQEKSLVPELIKEDLLIPPKVTNELPWKKGYFEMVGNGELKEGDKFDFHCFYDVVFDCYMDENGERILKRIEPCGSYGLASFSSIDDELSQALEIPLAE